MAVEVGRPKNVSSEFALNQLTKQGWQDGKGLGRDEQGIKHAIKVSGKNDKGGLGVDQSEQFVFHWWDHVFNKVASSIKVEDDDGEVKLSKDASSEKLDQISCKKPTNVAKGKELLYGRFVRSGTCHESDVKIDTKSEESSEDESHLDFSNHDTLEKVFRISGGRTAHKAARHGHRLNGKLKRLEEQEKNSPASTPQGSPKRSSQGYAGESSEKEKGFKRKHESVENEVVNSESKKRNKHKKKCHDPDNEVDLEAKKSKKKKNGCQEKHSKEEASMREFSVADFPPVENSQVKKTKKSKKKKSKKDESIEDDMNPKKSKIEKKEKELEEILKNSKTEFNNSILLSTEISSNSELTEICKIDDSNDVKVKHKKKKKKL